MPPWEAQKTAYVNLVALRMDAFPEYGSGLGEDFALDEDGAEEEEWDPDHVRVSLYRIGAEMYDDLYCFDTFERYARYRDGNGVSVG